MATTSYEVATAQGPGRWLVDPAEDPVAQLLLGHGAGGGPDSADLAVLARSLPALGVSVARFAQPWRVAGRRVAVAPPRLDEAWLLAVEWLGEQSWAAPRTVVGGRSAGARVACRTATALGVAGVVCLAFPLHPPGRPEKSRAVELLAPTVPRLVLQGGRDAFGDADAVRAAVAGAAGVTVVELPGADHGYRVPAAAPFDAAALAGRLVEEVARFVGRGE